jgi:hypothetical protein
MQHVLHTYRCLMVASLMFTFLIASLVTAILELDQSGLILGVSHSFFDGSTGLTLSDSLR